MVLLVGVLGRFIYFHIAVIGGATPDATQGCLMEKFANGSALSGRAIAPALCTVRHEPRGCIFSLVAICFALQGGGQPIKIEKHMPGIPSAHEVAGPGVSMGDMPSQLPANIRAADFTLGRPWQGDCRT